MKKKNSSKIIKVKETVVNKITTKEGLLLLGQYVPDIAFTTAVSTLAIQNPIWIPIFLTAKSLYAIYRDYGQERINEIALALEKHKDSFDSAVLKTDKFKSVFLNTLERHIKESSERKRELLRNYLISVAQGRNPEFDYHTKLFNILDQITGDELRLFMLLPNIIKDSDDEMTYLSSVGRVGIPNLSKREVNMNTRQVKMRLKNWKIKTRNLSALIHFLTNYGLIDSQDTNIGGIGGGGISDVSLKGITDIGEIFYDFIDDSLFSKEITDYTEYQKNPNLNLENFKE